MDIVNKACKSNKNVRFAPGIEPVEPLHPTDAEPERLEHENPENPDRSSSNQQLEFENKLVCPYRSFCAESADPAAVTAKMHEVLREQQQELEHKAKALGDCRVHHSTLPTKVKELHSTAREMIQPLNVLIKLVELQQSKGSLTLGQAAEAFLAIRTVTSTLQSMLKH
jgi:acetyl esterase/lipase